MKKIISAMVAGMMVCCAVSAQSIKIANTFGGDADSTGGSDLFTFQNQKNDDGSYKNEFGNETRVSDRIQMDASDKFFDARVRMEFATTKLNGKESTIRLRGYGRFKPIEQFQLIAGNDFSTKVAVDAGYLAASDDNPKYARILQSGFGAISNWKFGNEGNMSLKLAGGLRGTDNSFLDKDSLGLDAGLSFGMKDVFSIGATFQNTTSNSPSIAAFAGLNAVENLTLNVAYIYNDTDTDYITKTAKNVVSLTAGYNFKDAGLFIGADVISALGNEYLEKGETKTYEKAGAALTPFLTKLNVTYKATDNITVGTKAKIAMMLGDSDSVKTELYPNVTYKLPNKMGSLTTGVRMNLNNNGLSKFAIPFNWKCTLAEIKN
ncbi:MAG: hypothetical protein J6J00_07805 [Treponema sp.]|nr:hypothetical protein [Treponema sp.]